MRTQTIRRVAMVTVGSLLFFLVCNIPPLRGIPVILGLEPLFQSYHYQTADGKYHDYECPEKGRSLKVVEGEFDAYKASRGLPEVVLYRTSKRELWRFWLWSEYLTHPRWGYPYHAKSK